MCATLRMTAAAGGGRLLPKCAMLLCAVLAPVVALGEVTNPNGVAVIIGNRNYEHERVPEVSYADRDAAAFKHFVTEVLGFDPVTVIELHDATQADLESAFGNERNHEGTLWSYLDPEGGSDVVVFYSGHGVPGLNDGRGYLLPVDAHPDTADINGYPIDVLYANLGKLEEARSIAVYLDACFSGDSHAGMLVRSASPVVVVAELPEAAVAKLTVLTAASGTELASWDEEAEHGLFTHHLLDALYGKADADRDAQVTAGEAATYLKRYMTRAARRLFRRRQNATLLGAGGTVLSSAAGGVYPVRPALSALVGEASGVRLSDATAVGTIRNDDSAEITIADAAGEEGEPVVFTVTLAAPAAAAVTVDWATSVASGQTATPGTDFTAASGTLVIAGRSTTGWIAVATTADTEAEPDETFTVTLSAPSGGFPTWVRLSDATAVGTIRNDDSAEIAIGDRACRHA